MNRITFGQLMEAQIIHSFDDFYLTLKCKVVIDNVITRPLTEDKYTEFFDYPVFGIYPESKKGTKCLRIVLDDKEVQA